MYNSNTESNSLVLGVEVFFLWVTVQEFLTPQRQPAGAYPIHHLVSELLRVLSKEQLLVIWDKMPERIISMKPTLGEQQVFWNISQSY